MRSICLAVMLITLECISQMEAVLRCYKCAAAPSIYATKETLRLCQHFDYSEEFIVDCPYSTYCMKKIVSAKLPVTINATERDCAPQRFDTQNYKDGQWHPEIIIEEPYQEGCSNVNDKGLRTSHIEYCYCQGNLCNSARNTKTGTAISWTITMILFGVCYFYSASFLLA